MPEPHRVGHTVEVATPADAEQVGRIYRDSWPSTAGVQYGADEVARRLAGRGTSWWEERIGRSHVTLVGGTPGREDHGGEAWAGFVTVDVGGDEAHIALLYVIPESFGSGLADALVAAADALVAAAYEHVAGGGGVRWVTARILAGNSRSLSFAARLGSQIDPVARLDPETGKQFHLVRYRVGPA